MAFPSLFQAKPTLSSMLSFTVAGGKKDYKTESVEAIPLRLDYLSGKSPLLKTQIFSTPHACN
jgi:hypothetical protein